MKLDVHTHILPGMDDGSTCTDESFRMLIEEKEQGMATVVVTPHFYASRYSIEHFLEKREACLAHLARVYRTYDENMIAGPIPSQTLENLPQASNPHGLPKLILGAEVYYFPNMGKADLRPLCFRKVDSRMQTSTTILTPDPVILIEMPFEQWTEQVYQDIKDIVEKQRMVVILAHVERYWALQRDKTIWNKIFDLLLYPQINAESFLPKGLLHRKKSRWCMNFLKEHPSMLIGSDAHDLELRKPVMKEAREEIEKQLGTDALTRIDQLAGRMFEESDWDFICIS